MITLFAILGFLGILSSTVMCLYLFRGQCRAWAAVDRMKTQLSWLEKKFPAAEQQAHTKYLQNVAQFEERLDAEHINIISQALSGESVNDLLVLIKETIEKHCNRTTQEFLGNISDEAEGLTQDLQFALCDQIWDSFQQYKDKLDDTPYLIPRNVRLMYTKGVRTVVIVEQNPQIRTVGFVPQMVVKKEQEVAVRQNRHSYWFQLAFPYIYLVIAFDEGKYANLIPYFANAPLTSPKDKLYLAPLPNVKDSKENEGAHVCLGSETKAVVLKFKSISQQTEKLIDLFWSRIYSTDYGDGLFRQINEIDSLKKWQRRSEADPLFVLTINWPNGKTLKGIVEDMLDKRKLTEMDNAERAVRDLLHQGVDKLTQRIQEEIQNAKAFQAPKNLKPAAREQLEKVVRLHTQKVFEHCRG